MCYRNKSNDLLCKSMDWFLCDKSLHHERVNNRNKLDQTFAAPLWAVQKAAI